MSTSASTPPLGECVVCGQKTATRCSECARHGTEWMFFCSKEHQKLIWFVHKRVCGKRSQPFRWPALSDQEVQDMMVIGTKPSGCLTVDASSTWADVLAMNDGTPKIDNLRERMLEASFRRLQEPNSDEMLPVETNSKIIFARRYALKLKSSFGTTEEHYQAIRAHPFDYFAIQFNEMTDPKWSDQGDSSRWVSVLQHLFLIHIGVLVAGMRSGEWAARGAFEYTIEEVRRFIVAVVQKSHPAAARKMLDQIEEQKGRYKSD